MSKIPTTATAVLTDQNALTLPWRLFLQDLSFLANTAGVVSFNGRTGIVSLLGGDVVSALGYVPLNTLAPSFAGSAARLTTARDIRIIGDMDWHVSFDGSADVAGTGTLAATGVSAGSYTLTSITVDAKGRILGASNGVAVTSFNTRTGAVTLTSGDVTGALGYTPLNAAAPSFAGSAAKLTTPRNIAITGDLAWNVNFDGSANVTAAGTLATVNGSPGAFGAPNLVPVVTVNGKGLVTAVTGAIPVVPGCQSGQWLSTAGASTTFSVSAGSVADSTAAVLMVLGSPLAKTTAAWSVGAGGALDTGTIANNTGYHVYTIRRPDTGVVDVCISTSASAPTFGSHIPAAYTQYRRRGWLRTNGSGQWVKFLQVNSRFLWDAPIGDVVTQASTTTPALRTLTAPSGLSIEALLGFSMQDTSGATNGGLLYCPLGAAQAMNTPAGNGQIVTVGSGGVAQCACSILTNATAQVESVTLGNANINIATIGWIDERL